MGIVGAAVYALRTERGHEIQGQIGETLTDSMGRIREVTSASWTRIRDAAMDAGERLGLTENLESEQPESESYQPQGLRRVG